MGKLLKISVVAVLAGLFLVAVPIDAAYAQSAGKILKQRQSVMKELNGHVKAVRKFVEGPKAGLSRRKLKKAIRKLGHPGDMELRAQAIADQFPIWKHSRVYSTSL